MLLWFGKVCKLVVVSFGIFSFLFFELLVACPVCGAGPLISGQSPSQGVYNLDTLEISDPYKSGQTLDFVEKYRRKPRFYPYFYKRQKSVISQAHKSQVEKSK